MANIFDNDILITQSSNEILLDLSCGFGQPCTTTVYLKKQNGESEVKHQFDGNVEQFALGDVGSLKYNSIEIHTTIKDIRDSDTEKLDIALDIKVYDTPINLVDTAFTKKTKGKGSVFHSFYTITIF